MSRFDEMSDRAARSVEHWQRLAAAEFATGVRHLLARRGISQRELAEALGKSEVYVSRVLNRGENLTIQQMQRLLEPLGGAAHVVVIDRENVVDWSERARQRPETEPSRRTDRTAHPAGGSSVPRAVRVRLAEAARGSEPRDEAAVSPGEGGE